VAECLRAAASGNEHVNAAPIARVGWGLAAFRALEAAGKADGEMSGAAADASTMPPPRSTRASRQSRTIRHAEEPKPSGRKRGGGGRGRGSSPADDVAPAAASQGGLDGPEAKRQRRLEQNRIAAKKAYDKRVKRQADMEQEYESLRRQLQETNAQAATLGAFLSQTGLTGRLRSGEETPPLGQLPPKSTKRSRQPAPNPGVPVAHAPATNSGPTESARPGTQYRRVQSIEALTSLVSMVEESSEKPS
jgi:hypothetical protein